MLFMSYLLSWRNRGCLYKIIEKETELIGINNKNKNKNLMGFIMATHLRELIQVIQSTELKTLSKQHQDQLILPQNLLTQSIKNLFTGTHQAESIKIAESAKVIENTQRDIKHCINQ